MTNTKGLVLGIVSLACAVCGAEGVTIAFAIAGLIVGIIGYKNNTKFIEEVNAEDKKANIGKKLALAGIIVSAVAIGISVIVLIVCSCAGCAAAGASAMGSY